MTGPHGTAFSGRVGWGGAPAVVVVDLVRAYTAAGGPFLLPDPAPAVAATEALVAAAREHGHPVVWTVVRYTSGLADGGLFVRKVPALAAFAEDADGGWGELVLTPAAGEPSRGAAGVRHGPAAGRAVGALRGGDRPARTQAAAVGVTRALRAPRRTAPLRRTPGRVPVAPAPPTAASPLAGPAPGASRGEAR